jgi:hypothetical protein
MITRPSSRRDVGWTASPTSLGLLLSRLLVFLVVGGFVVVEFDAHDFFGTGFGVDWFGGHLSYNIRQARQMYV